MTALIEYPDFGRAVYCADHIRSELKTNGEKKGRDLRCYLGRKIKAEPMTPRSTNSPPAMASNGLTQENGTREMTSIRIPRRARESPRVQFSQRNHHSPGL